MFVMDLGRRLMLGLVLGVWAGGLLACGHGPVPVRQQPPGRDFLIIGHRGAPQRAGENTLESFDQALRLGANALELNVSMTRDGQLVLWHDWRATLENDVRTTGACRLVHPAHRQPIHTVFWEEFLRDYGYEQTGQRVPVTTFAAWVSRFAHDTRVRFFFVDLKIPADLPDWVAPLFQQAVQTLRRQGALPKAVFTTPHEAIFHPLHAQAQAWHRTIGEHVDVALDTEGPQGLRLGPWPSAVHRNQSADARFALWGKPVLTVQSSRGFLARAIRRRDAVNATRPSHARLQLIVWTVNDARALCELLDLGVDGIMTDEPDRLRALVQGWRQPGTCHVP
jgi:glycerophosphoryl diester phosphodiesterase